ncbi:MAG: DUF11 domain-containing protein [Gemmataceae bacterium]|nr:DUF11 domain-containing protein [Gemmataceae bacterium]
MPPRWSRHPAPRPGLRVEPLEDRSVPAVVPSFAGGVLTVSLTAPNDAATVTGTDPGGTKIAVSDGAATQTFDGVSSVVVQDPGANPGQRVTFNGTGGGRIALTGPVSTSGVETVTVGVAGGPIGAASFAVAGATAVRLDNGVTTTGPAGQSYAGPVVVGAAAVTLNAGAAGGVTFGSTVNAAAAGAGGLTVNAGGTTDFVGPVGGAAPLANLTTDAAGTTVLRAGVTTAGGQTFNDPVTVGGTAILVSSTGSGAVAFNGTVNGQDGKTNALTVNTAGATTFGAAVGGSVPLSALTTDAAGTTTLAANVTTTASQTYGDPVTVSGAAVALTSTGTGTVFFANAINGAAAGGTALAVNTGGTTTFGGSVGATTALASLATDAAGSTVFGLGSGTVVVRTADAQTYNDPVRVSAGGANFASTGNGRLAFNGTLNGTAGIATAVTATTGGPTAFSGAVGGTSPLASLTTDGAGTTTLGNAVTTSAHQSYGDPVTVAPAAGVTAVTLSSQAGRVEFLNTLAGASAVPLTLQAGTDLVLRNNVFLTANGSQLTAQAGATGAGRFDVVPAVQVRADRQTWRAGNGPGGAAAAATGLRATITFLDAAGASAPRQYVYRQDATITEFDLPSDAQFNGNVPADYKIISDDGGVVLNGSPVVGPGTAALTLSAATGVGIGTAINAPAAVVRLRAGSGAVVQTAGGITAAALAAQAATGVELTAAGNAVAAFAARTTAGDVRFSSGTPYTVGVVAADPVVTGLTTTTGVTATAGTVVLGQTGNSPLDLTVAAPVSGTAVAVVGGIGNDRLTVNYSLAGTANPVLPNGLGFVGNAGGDTLVLTDVGGTAGHTYDINNQVRRDNSQPVTYSDLEFLTVTGSDAADTFNVTPAKQPTAPGGPIPIEGLAGPQLTLAGGGPTGATGDTLNFTVPAGVTPTFTTSSAADGITGTASFDQPLVGGGFVQAVSYRQMEAVSPQADVRVTVTGPGSVAPGGTATFTVVVTNAGPAAASGVRLTDLSPAGLTNATFTVTGTSGGASASPSGGPVGVTGGVLGSLSTLTLPANGSVTFTVTGTAGGSGTAGLTATVSGPADALDPVPANNTAVAEAPVQAVDLLAVGAGPGGGPQVKVYNPDGSERFNFFAYDPAYRGGVAVATGDVTGDGVEDVVTGSATGATHVKVFDGRTGGLAASFFAFPGFGGGVNVAVAGGRVVAGAGAGGGPVVKGFDVAGGGAAEAYSFLAYDGAFRGGVSVAGAGDLIATGPGAGGGPNVKVFRAADRSLVSSFFAFPAATTGGVSVGLGLRGTTPVVVAGAGAGGLPTAVTFDAQTGSQLTSVLAFDSTFRGGVRTAGGTTANGQPAAVVGAGPGGSPRVRVFGPGNAVAQDFFAFDPSFTGGVYVG